MNIEDRIRLIAHRKIRVLITSRKRNTNGFEIRASDGTKTRLPTRKIALQFLLAIVRCAPVKTFELKPAKGRTL